MLLLSGEATNTNFIVFDMTRPRLEPMIVLIYYSRSTALEASTLTITLHKWMTTSTWIEVLLCQHKLFIKMNCVLYNTLNLLCHKCYGPIKYLAWGNIWLSTYYIQNISLMNHLYNSHSKLRINRELNFTIIRNTDRMGPIKKGKSLLYEPQKPTNIGDFIRLIIWWRKKLWQQ
jgi:hypothetical protein